MKVITTNGLMELSKRFFGPSCFRSLIAILIALLFTHLLVYTVVPDVSLNCFED
jgi:hypothetical protein